ncbi:MAG: hypothetical protein IJM30_09555 [Thermoguttaceae bacterium]|nr:hypothetical protein [Thermoguttaceae bacterium]
MTARRGFEEFGTWRDRVGEGTEARARESERKVLSASKKPIARARVAARTLFRLARNSDIKVVLCTILGGIVFFASPRGGDRHPERHFDPRPVTVRERVVGGFLGAFVGGALAVGKNVKKE